MTQEDIDPPVGVVTFVGPGNIQYRFDPPRQMEAGTQMYLYLAPRKRVFDSVLDVTDVQPKYLVEDKKIGE